jgi:hypothetical protein
LPFKLMRSAMVAGGRYGLSCLGCTAGLIVAMVLIGMSNLAWNDRADRRHPDLQTGPRPNARWTLALSSVVIVLGIAFAALV